MISAVSDTLVVDTLRLNAWRADSQYDYSREFVQSDFSIIGWIREQISRFFDSIFGSRFYEDNATFIYVMLGLMVVAGFVYFLYRKHPELFGRSGKVEPTVMMTEDTIYGVDFEAGIARALSEQNYREAVRLVYLQTLKNLSDAGRIDWKPYKTPTEYTREVPTADFRLFSMHFLRVRYGNFEATQPLVDEMQQLRQAILHDLHEARKGGAE
jgi:hypothetical protein